MSPSVDTDGACAYSSSDGNFQCFGSGSRGRLGRGSTANLGDQDGDMGTFGGGADVIPGGDFDPYRIHLGKEYVARCCAGSRQF